MLEQEIEHIEIRLMLQAIHDRYGYDLRDYAQASMARRVKAALASSGAQNLGELQHRLLIDPALFARVLDALTVQVSEMFRDPVFYVRFKEHVVPVLRTYPLIKIWHAGCAGGEEVYATAILLEEAGLYARSQIYATDLSSSALERAKEGTYPARSAALFAKNYREAGGRANFEDHCSEAYGHVTVKESLRRNVVFFQHDLVSDHNLGEMQVVFCRNVLIYFGQELRRRVLEKLSSAVCHGGYLCFGQSERLSGKDLVAAFDPIETDTPIYRNRASA